jgi:hypothetical protein
MRRLRLFPFSPRTRFIVWSVSLTIILFGPIVQAAIDLHRVRGAATFGFREVQPAKSQGEAPAGAAGAASRAANYLARRNPIVDRLLPEGEGGTRFFEQLGEYAGLAAARNAAIALTVTNDYEPWPETVELHERAHLLDAFQFHEVENLMARLPHAESTEYAAKNRAEHFGEMAAKAWEIVSPPDGICVDGTPVDVLRKVEVRVPGTAGFVAWYLRQPSLGVEEGRDELSALAAELSAPQRAEWDALWQALESHRRPDGTFEKWRYSSVRAYLEVQQSVARSVGGWFGRGQAILLVPSLAIARLAERSAAQVH